MANLPRGPSLGMSQIGTLSGRMELAQKLVMTPPIAGSVDAVAENAKHFAKPARELGQDILDAVKAYVKAEDRTRPYTDSQILEYMVGQGHEIERRDIAYARRELGIRPSSARGIN